VFDRKSSKLLFTIGSAHRVRCAVFYGLLIVRNSQDGRRGSTFLFRVTSDIACEAPCRAGRIISPFSSTHEPYILARNYDCTDGHRQLLRGSPPLPDENCLQRSCDKVTAAASRPNSAVNEDLAGLADR